MATLEECEKAMRSLADKMAANDPSRRKVALDRSLSCTLRDLDATFGGELKSGLLTDIRELDAARGTPPAEIRLDMTSDDLLALVDGRLNVASAWATGRIKIDARKMDLLRLRSIF